MTVTVKLSDKQQYSFSLRSEAQPVRTKAYMCAIRIINAITWSLCRVFVFFDRIFSRVDAGLNALSLRCAKIHSTALSGINHSYSASSAEQKSTFANFINNRLKAAAPHLNEIEQTNLAKKIAHDSAVFDIGGLCLGYSWLFAAFALSQPEKDLQARVLKNRFMQHEFTKLAPVISFTTHVDFTSLIRTEGSVTSICGNALRYDHLSMPKQEEAIATLKALAYPSFTLEEATTAKAIKAKAADYRKYARSILNHSPVSMDEVLTIRKTLNSKFKAVMDLDKRAKKGLCLQEQIQEFGQIYDGKALILSIKTQDPRSGHAMCVYASSEKNSYLFFDPNLGVISFKSLQDLAKGVASYSKAEYTATEAYIDVVSL